MENNDELLQLARALQAVIALQANEASSSSIFAQVLDKHFPGLNAEYQAARNTTASQVPASIQSLRQQIDAIVRRLSQSQH